MAQTRRFDYNTPPVMGVPVPSAYVPYMNTPRPIPTPMNKSQFTPLTKLLKQHSRKVLIVFGAFCLFVYSFFQGEREQYGIQDSDRSSPSIARSLTDAELAIRSEGVQNSGNKLCRDAVSAYYCSFVERCGRGSCIPFNRIRCDDKPDGSTYDCRKGQTCGKGRCVPFGKKLCDTGSQSRFCNGLNACCQGTLSMNSQVSCLPGSSCPAGTVQVMQYQHVDYQYSGEET
jgi:hypothetical protein